MTDFAVGLELFVDGAWADITPDLSDDGVQITRGRQNEGTQTDPARMTCNLRNNDGKYSPRNPRSTLYGLIGRNTPIRFWVETGEVRLVQDAQTQWYTADSAGLSITGDIDLRVDIAPRTWRPEASISLGLVKSGAYYLKLESDGQLRLYWYQSTTLKFLGSSVPVPGGITGRKAVRATLDVDNGASTAVATFYYSDSLTGSWTQFGSAQELGSTTSIADSSNTLGTYCDIPAELYGVEVRSGISGTVKASVDWTADVDSGATTYTDSSGNVWTPSGNAVVTSRHYRFVGEVTAWPQKWGLKGAPSVYSPIECAGVLRRLGQGASPLQSPMRRGCATLPNLVGYWPMEEADGADSFQAVEGLQPGRITGPVDVAAYSSFLASDHVPTLSTGKVFFAVSPYQESGEAQIRWLASFPTTPLTNDSVLMRIRTASTLGWVDVIYSTTNSGSWYLKVYTSLGVLSLTTGTLDSDSGGLNGRKVRLSLTLAQSGGSVNFALNTYEEGASASIGISDTKAGITLGRITSVEVNPGQVDLGQFAFGHLTVEKDVTSSFDVAEQFAAYAGERADTRMLRLADENDLSLAVIGAGAGCERMGPQGIDDLVTLLRDAATSDGGVLYEPRIDNSLRYRSLETLWSQDPAVAIAYTDNLLIPFEPVDDDEGTRNKVTVTRRTGGSFTAEDSTGSLGTLPPPDGVGIYDESLTLSLATDAAAEQQAGWHLHLGTTDEARWPKIGLDLAHPTFLSDAELTRQILTLDVGDRLDVTDLPDWLPPFPVRQLVQGYSETIAPLPRGKRGRSSADAPFTYKLTFNCTPARPYSVGAYVASGFASTTIAVDATPVVASSSSAAVGSGNVTVTKPSGTADGDVLVAICWSDHDSGSASTISAPVGWSQVGSDGSSTGGFARVFKKTASSEGASYVFTMSSSSANIVIVHRVTGASTGTFDVNPTWSATATTSASRTAPSITPANTDSLMICGYWVISQGSTVTVTPPTGFTESQDLQNASKFATAEAAWKTLTASGATGTKTATLSGTIGSGFQDLNVSMAIKSGDTTSTSVTAIDAGPSSTRFSSGASVLNANLAIDATSAAVKVNYGPQWTTAAADLPLDLLIAGEQVTATAIGSPSAGVQTFTLTRAVNDITKAHVAGEAVELLDPVYWGARPLGGTLFTGGSDTGGGGGVPDTTTPNTVRIGTATYPLSGVNPGSTGGWGGDANYPGYRGVDQLVVYSQPTVTTTVTNQWGAEGPTDSDLIINSLNDRQASQSLTGTSVPASGYVVSGHGAARQWLLANATVGAQVELVYVAPSGGGTGGGSGGGGTGGGTTSGAWGNWSVCVYHLSYSSSTRSFGNFNTECNEFRLAFAFDQSGSIKLASNNFAATDGTWNAAIAARRTAGAKIIISLGGAGNTVTTSSPTTAVTQIIAIGTLLGGFDGIDWDIEAGSSFPTANAIAISQGLKDHYGANFGITMAPNGSNVGNYLPAAVQLHQAGLLTWYAQQFYDSPVSLAAAKGRIAEALNAGLPASKLGVGMALSSSVSGGFWSQATCQTNMQDIRNTYGVRRCYLWEANTPSNAAALTWVANMYDIVSPE